MARFRRFALVLILAVPFGTAALSMPGAGDPDLTEMRAARRLSMHTALAGPSKTASTTFSLLVIPVDFRDLRLPAPWTGRADFEARLSSRSDESLLDYFQVASHGRLDLKLVIAPLVNLSKDVIDYSDLGLSNPYNTRLMVTEALSAVRDMGLGFALADNDGPDGRPGSGDDDGEVDGILVLHAAAGVETDPETGLIVPHQWYLDAPVLDRGTSARFYALASLHAGLGVWVHETAHLFGLEDRYDTNHVSDIDVGNGGLGIFSLMAFGAWGRGDGSGPSLMDAYSALQLGWASLREKVGESDGVVPLDATRRTGEVWRMTLPGTGGREYYLLESRGASADHRYDAVVPPGQLIVYHVDETVPDDAQSSYDPLTRHLRVAILEADGDGALARMEDPGSVSDLFPGSLGITRLGGGAPVSSDGYEGAPGPVLGEIASTDTGVAFSWSMAGIPYETGIAFTAGPDTTLEVRISGRSGPLDRPTIEIVRSENVFPWGDFDSPADTIRLRTASLDGGVTWTTTDAPHWRPHPDTPSGATTTLVFDVRLDGQAVAHEREWLWTAAVDPLDYPADWPGDWEIIDEGDPGSDWRRWRSLEGQPLPEGDYLICSAGLGSNPGIWPDVSKSKNMDISLRSPALRVPGRALRLLHAVDAHVFDSGLATDGALVEYLDTGGAWRPLIPVGGYPTRIETTVYNPAAGRAVFAGPLRMDEGDVPFWTESWFLFPQDAGLVWTRLRFRFVSDIMWRSRIWLIADMQLRPAEEASGFAPRVDAEAGSLRWRPPAEPVSLYLVDRSLDDGRSWETVWSGSPLAPDGGSESLDLTALPAGPRGSRTLLRVEALTNRGVILSGDASWITGFTSETGLRIGIPKTGENPTGPGRPVSRSTTCGDGPSTPGPWPPVRTPMSGTGATARVDAWPRASISSVCRHPETPSPGRRSC